jgi:hypothetical protein
MIQPRERYIKIYKGYEIREKLDFARLAFAAGVSPQAGYKNADPCGRIG